MRSPLRSLCLCVPLILLGLPAAGREPVQQAVGTLIAYDRPSQTLAVRERDVARVYRVRRGGPEATQVSWDSKPARLEELPVGAVVSIHWRWDPAGRPVVQRIDAPRVHDPGPPTPALLSP